MAGKSVLLKLFVLASLLLTPAGSSLNGQEKSSEGPSNTAGSRDGLIGPDDALTIFVPTADDISKTWRVSAIGELTLPLVGKVQAAGKTVDEFEETLTAELKTYLRDPQVTVSLVDVRSQPVTIMGAVEKPQKLQLERRMTLLGVLIAAGGTKEAGPTLTVTRKIDRGRIPLAEARDDQDGKYSVATLKMDEILEGRGPAANLVIEPQDIISVSTKTKPLPKLVQIIGEVHKPGAVELVQQESVSIMQALAAAGGITHTAALSKTVIMHINMEGVRTEIAQIDLKKVMEGKVKDIELGSGDIVIVPTSQVKSYLDIASRSLVGSGTMVLARF